MNKEYIYTRIRKTSIRKRLLFLLLVQAIIVLLWSFSLLKQSVTSYIDSLAFQNAQIINTFQEDISNAITTLSSVTKFPIIKYANEDDTILNELAKENYSLANYNYNNYIRKHMASLLDMNPNIYFISIMNKTGKHIYCLNKNTSSYYTTIDSPTPGYYDLAAAAKGKLIIRNEATFQSLNIATPRFGIYGIRSVISIKPYQSIGAVICCIDLQNAMSSFELSRYFPEQNIAVYDPDGMFLTGSTSLDAYPKLLNISKDNLNVNQLYSTIIKINKEVKLYHYALSNDNYLCVIETPYALVIHKIIERNILLFVFLILLVTSMISTTNFLLRSIESPIGKLSKACEAIQREEFGIIVEDNASDEMNKLIQSFNSMSKKTQFLIEEVYQKEALRLKSELQFLRTQINPHFIYNTLETIRSAALLDNNQDIANIASLFGKILRNGISNTDPLVSVETEINNLKDYISLQKTYYKDRLMVNINIDTDLYNYTILKLVLQPLVENSIYHGISTVTYVGIIDIIGYQENDIMVITVSDNGLGVDNKTVDQINDYINEKNVLCNGIGLKNVNRRIQLHYGKEYGLTFHSVQYRGSMVTLKIPLHPIDHLSVTEEGST